MKVFICRELGAENIENVRVVSDLQGRCDCVFDRNCASDPENEPDWNSEEHIELLKFGVQMEKNRHLELIMIEFNSSDITDSSEEAKKDVRSIELPHCRT